MESPAPKQRSALVTILRWFFFANIALITIVALFYAIENFRGHRAWEHCRKDAESRGAKLKFADHIPPAVPDEQNAANVPLVHSWFAEKTRGRGDPLLWPHLFERAQGLIAGYRGGSRGRLHPTDLVAWQQALAFAETNADTRTQVSLQPTNLAAMLELAAKDVGKTTPKIWSTARSAAEQAQGARAVLAALKIYDPALDEFRAAMKRPQMRYPVQYDTETPFSILLPHLAGIKGVFPLLRVRVSANLAAGKSDAAFDDVLMGLRLADSLEQDQFLISELVRIACVHIIMQPVWEGMVQHRWTEPQLKALQEQFEKYDWMPALAHSLSTERAAGITTIDWIKSQSSGKRFNALGGSGNDGDFSGSSAAGGSRDVVAALMPRGWWDMEKVSYAHITDTMMAHAERGSKAGATVSMDQFDEALFVRRGPSAIWHHEMMANLLVPAVGRAYLKFCAVQVATGEAAVACALERARIANGSYPQSLDGLTPKFLARAPIDFVSGAPFHYRVEGNGYVLYSVGWNQQDDGGRPGKTMFDDKDGDWVWQVPAKDQFE